MARARKRIGAVIQIAIGSVLEWLGNLWMVSASGTNVSWQVMHYDVENRRSRPLSGLPSVAVTSMDTNLLYSCARFHFNSD